MNIFLPSFVPFTKEDIWNAVSTPALNAWDAVWVRGNLEPHIVTWVFFRVVGVIFPGTVAIEALLCHTIAFLYGKRSLSMEIENGAKLAAFDPLTAENARLINNAAQTERAMAQLRIDLSQARGEAATARTAHANAEADLSDIKKKCAEFKSSAETSATELEKKVVQLQAADVTIAKLTSQNRVQEQQIISLQDQVQTLKSDTKLRDQLTDLQKLYDENIEALEEHLENSGKIQVKCKELEVIVENSKKNAREMLEKGIKLVEESASEIDLDLSLLTIPLERLIALSVEEGIKHKAISRLFELQRGFSK